ncbi:hypothetical protein TGRUB_252310 [Toxoplasma gondii RUB]|uniref:DNA polymerase epsilon p17 subunit n=1 Tax=Toxoplasma gondii RUB TaxID=935652 RepID=A0A086LMS5_TOXGO|nr:hypothetical protein TGRUB_252310 [Toxoplasma gondii RUB]
MDTEVAGDSAEALSSPMSVHEEKNQRSAGAQSTSCLPKSANLGRSFCGSEALRLPRAHAVRIIKGALPPNVRLHRKAATALMRCSAIFLLALADASSAAGGGSRKTVGTSDVLAGLRSMGFDNVAEEIEEHMRSEAEGESREAAKAASSGVHTPDESGARGPATEAQNTKLDAQSEDALSSEERENGGRSQDEETYEDLEDEEQETDALDAMMQVVDGVLAEREPYSDGQADPLSSISI